MENDSANILKGEEPRDVAAVGENGERETNAPNQFKAPRAVEERETNVTCQGKTAESTRTRETTVPEERSAAMRRDGEPLTSEAKRRRQTELERRSWIGCGRELCIRARMRILIQPEVQRAKS